MWHRLTLAGILLCASVGAQAEGVESALESDCAQVERAPDAIGHLRPAGVAVISSTRGVSSSPTFMPLPAGT